ncbi:MAG: hypothetical protein ABIK31_01535 [candidate division WOR-3 bacterium]
MNINYAALKEFIFDKGATILGIADLSKVKKDDFLIEPELLSKFTFAISIGVKLLEGVLLDIKDHPTLLYFHHYRQVNTLLDRIALQVAFYLENQGYLALPIAASQIVDWKTQRAHLSHKRIAIAAGLGWLGRNNLLVTSDYGSQIRLVTVLTNALFINFDSQQLDFGCNECRLCINVCPAQAIKERPEDFDHLRCFEKLKEFQKKGYVGQYICGVCVKVCQGKIIR